MLGSRVRATLLGLMALLVVGSYAATAAYAEGGPWVHHRLNAKEGKGAKIEEATPEKIEGTGGEQTLKGEIGTNSFITIKSAEVKVTGILYNNANQAQVKVEQTYAVPKLEPEAKTCTIVIGANNTVKLFGHQEWKWNGTVAQLLIKPQKAEQVRDWVFVAKEFAPTTTEETENELKSPESEFTTITISKNGGAECLLAGAYKVTGSQGALGFNASTGKAEQEEWGQTEKVVALGSQIKLQHDWFAKSAKFQGLRLGLLVNKRPGEYKGSFQIKTSNQEVAYFEE